MENTGNTKGIPSGNRTETGIPMMMVVGMMMKMKMVKMMKIMMIL